jgi:NADPH:quinone reductase-like Zn-dependent oxidoreductase
MKAAVVQKAGETPVFADFANPVAGPGEVKIHVSASALSQLARGRASGSHYSSKNTFPFVAGVDGVGKTEDGRRVYFVLPRSPYGAMAEQTVVRAAQTLPLPDGLDDVTAAAMANPGMSSWAAFTHRARLKAGETVLVNGATGTSGRLAVQIAKHLGARKVIATGRNPEALSELRELGADVTISLSDSDEAITQAFMGHFSGRIDVVIDYLWGKSAQALLIAGAKAGAEATPIRFVQVGSMSGGEITLPSAVLRSSAIELMGSGIGSVPLEGLLDSIRGVFAAALPAKLKIASQPAPLAELGKHWAEDSSGRLVFTVS